jgi:hypothetical protein
VIMKAREDQNNLKLKWVQQLLTAGDGDFKSDFNLSEVFIKCNTLKGTKVSLSEHRIYS